MCVENGPIPGLDENRVTAPRRAGGPAPPRRAPVSAAWQSTVPSLRDGARLQVHTGITPAPPSSRPPLLISTPSSRGASSPPTATDLSSSPQSTSSAHACTPTRIPGPERRSICSWTDAICHTVRAAEPCAHGHELLYLQHHAARITHQGVPEIALTWSSLSIRRMPLFRHEPNSGNPWGTQLYFPASPAPPSSIGVCTVCSSHDTAAESASSVRREA